MYYTLLKVLDVNRVNVFDIYLLACAIGEIFELNLKYKVEVKFLHILLMNCKFYKT